jgi:hypothetical protein
MLSPATSPSRHRSSILPWLGLSTRIARLLYAQFHSANKITVPSHSNNTSAFFASSPILAQNHSGIGGDPQYLQLYFISTRG